MFLNQDSTRHVEFVWGPLDGMEQEVQSQPSEMLAFPISPNLLWALHGDGPAREMPVTSVAFYEVDRKNPQSGRYFYLGSASPKDAELPSNEPS